jgi:hypothetical protein
MVRLACLFLIILIGTGLWHWIDPAQFTKENMEEAIKKEKTINTVQREREKRRLEADKIMDQF